MSKIYHFSKYIKEKEKKWYFHTPNPTLDDHEFDLTPHFDDLDGLKQTTFFASIMAPPPVAITNGLSFKPISTITLIEVSG